jgi:hypothetical protein
MATETPVSRPCFAAGSRIRFDGMRLYALTELHDPEAIKLVITEEEAKRALEDCLRDEPQ